MNLTPLQERKLKQFEDEIKLLEDQVRSRRIFWVIRLSWAVTMIFLIVDFLMDFFIDHKTILSFINEYSWRKLAVNFITWMAIYYFFLVKGKRDTLKRRREEIAAYESKLRKEAIA